MAINLPKAIRPVLVEIATLNDETFSSILEALRRMPALVNAKDIDAFCAAEASVLPLLVEVTRAASSLAGGKISTELSTPDFLDEVIKAAADIPNIQGDAGLAKLHTRLAQLIAIPAIAVGAKASSVEYDRERLLLSTRILTDARPVFDDDEVGAPLTTLIIHTLKIEYHEDSSQNSFFVSLDGDDLIKLKTHVERALSKAAALKAVLQTAGLSVSETRYAADSRSSLRAAPGVTNREA